MYKYVIGNARIIQLVTNVNFKTSSVFLFFIGLEGLLGGKGGKAMAALGILNILFI
jgi:hypothetical protein